MDDSTVLAAVLTGIVLACYGAFGLLWLFIAWVGKATSRPVVVKAAKKRGMIIEVEGAE